MEVGLGSVSKKRRSSTFCGREYGPPPLGNFLGTPLAVTTKQHEQSNTKATVANTVTNDFNIEIKVLKNRVLLWL
jgi:hypothetical protein